jgi:hypothetical protein
MRTRNLKESVVVWREAVLEEVQGIVQQVCLLTVPQLRAELNRLRVLAHSFV